VEIYEYLSEPVWRTLRYLLIIRDGAPCRAFEILILTILE
jgi:hypothetical protein